MRCTIVVGEVPERDHPERARLYAQARRIDNGAACVLLVIHTDHGWTIHGLDLPGAGIHVPNDPMLLLAESIVDRSGR